MVWDIFVPTVSNIGPNFSQQYRLTVHRHFMMASNVINELPSIRRKILGTMAVFSFKKLSGDIIGCVRNEYCWEMTLNRNVTPPLVSIF